MNEEEKPSDQGDAPGFIVGENAARADRALLARAIIIITRVRDQNSPRGLDAEVEAWLRDARTR